VLVRSANDLGIDLEALLVVEVLDLDLQLDYLVLECLVVLGSGLL